MRLDRAESEMKIRKACQFGRTADDQMRERVGVPPPNPSIAANDNQLVWQFVPFPEHGTTPTFHWIE
jgi:hypothetical protein